VIRGGLVFLSVEDSGRTQTGHEQRRDSDQRDPLPALTNFLCIDARGVTLRWSELGDPTARRIKVKADVTKDVIIQRFQLSGIPLAIAVARGSRSSIDSRNVPAHCYVSRLSR
jgi:hypothetical protein